MSLQQWRESPSNSTASFADQAAASGFTDDIKNLLSIILFVATIVATCAWLYCSHKPRPPQLNVPAATDPLYPWCVPERDECWR